MTKRQDQKPENYSRPRKPGILHLYMEDPEETKVRRERIAATTAKRQRIDAVYGGKKKKR